ncbi:hypothetical protein ACU4GD_07340 [Cupriavidus basilensis]
MVPDKLERRLAGPARTSIEAGYAIEVDILQVEDGSWGSLVRLSAGRRPGARRALHAQPHISEDRAMAFSYTPAPTRACVTQFAPAAATTIAELLRSGNAGRADTADE